MQGRLPIRVELEALSPSDFEKILTEPNASLTEQYIALMATEGVKLSFERDAIRRIAEIAWKVNEKTENIGARRLHTVMEQRLLEEISFSAGDKIQDTFVVYRTLCRRDLGTIRRRRPQPLHSLVRLFYRYKKALGLR